MRRAVAALLLLSLGPGSGCSILFAKGPPERVEPHEPIRCTRSYALPTVDGIVAGLQALRTAYAFSLSNEDYKDNPSMLTRSTDIGIGIALTTLFAVSTGVGISRVGDCNELLEKVERRPEPRRIRPGNPFAPPPPPSIDADADSQRAGAASSEEAKAAGEAAGASQRKQQP